MPGETNQDQPDSPIKRPRTGSEQWVMEYTPVIPGVERTPPYHMLAWWKVIWEYLSPTLMNILHLRRLCHLFKDSLAPPPPGIYTVFPHPNHAWLSSLTQRLCHLHEQYPTKVPTILFIHKGLHAVGERSLNITYPMKIIGAGRDETVLQGGGGFNIAGKKEDDGQRVELTGMTITESSDTGLKCCDSSSLSFLCKDMTFTKCDGHGVFASDANGRLQNCTITQCVGSGIYCGSNALIAVEGDETKVDGNVKSGVRTFGIMTEDMSSKIYLASPLTKESVATNNGSYGNYGNFSLESTGEIAIVDGDGNKIEIIQEMQEAEVEEDDY
jgi:hypothetical protein